MVSPYHLPEEIWVHVFGYLPVRDKLAVRSCCKCFKRLVDHRNLWINRVIVLKSLAVSDTRFWRTLNRWQISSIVLQKPNSKVFELIARWLPLVRSVTVSDCSDGMALAALSLLRHIERLVIRRTSNPLDLIKSLLSLTNPKLTNLCLCEIKDVSADKLSSAVVTFGHLTTLYFHKDDSPLSKVVFHSMLRNLPHLKHLSLRLGPKNGILPDDYFCPIRKRDFSGKDDAHIGPVLSSLELLNYKDPCLSSKALNPLSSLTKLSVHYKEWVENATGCHLAEWMQGLPLLTELNVSLGYPLGVYAGSIPGSVRNICLMGVKADLTSVRIMGKQLPDLLQLHLDLCCYEICDIISAISQLFPKLEVLKVRHQNVPASVFLQLQHLPKLKQLMILDAPQGSPIVRELTQKLNSQRDNIFHVLSFDPKNQTTCTCGFY